MCGAKFAPRILLETDRGELRRHMRSHYKWQPDPVLANVKAGGFVKCNPQISTVPSVAVDFRFECTKGSETSVSTHSVPV